ncbi:MAG: lipid-binding SYLF domain-containing protein [Nitrospirae bacterium]|nr:lipid-binding SYLF domain-containing protein [Nitrospirota bacterium]
MKKIIMSSMAFLLILFLSSSYAGWDPRDREDEERAVKDTISRLLSIDPSLQIYFDKAYAYAVLPTVGKGAFIGGVGYGRGWFFENGKPIGKVSITQLSAGAQIGGQAYREVVFFRDKDRAEDFKNGRFEAGAQLSAIVVTEGVGKAGTYTDGVAVFILPTAGFMAEASISGQRFGFEPF